jgi:outer membrane protein TolC
VLEDAIRNAELKRSQAILGTYDITAFVEGTNFPFASRDFDDRVNGWQVIAGITVRLNDRRVLTSSLKKAEAEIRSYRAQIAAEENDIRDQITIRADRLLSYFRSRSEITANISRARAQFEERCEAYFWRQAAKMIIDDVLTPLYMLTDAQVQLATNLNQITDAENDLLVATGEVYRLVGIQIERTDSGTELYEMAASQPAAPSSQPE